MPATPYLNPNKTLQLGRMSHQPWRKALYFVSPSYRAKAFWSFSGVGCLIFLWSVVQAFMAADLAAFDAIDRLSYNYSVFFTIVIGLLIAGLCLVICFQGVSLSLAYDSDADGNRGRLELRQSFKKPRHFSLSSYKYTRIISNELSQASTTTTQRQLKSSAQNRSFANALKNNSHTAVISFNEATLSFECQDIEALESLKLSLDNSL